MIRRRILMALALLFHGSQTLAGGGQSELAAKAAFLARFGAYVTWPQSVIPPGAPLTLCVIGDDPFGSVLEQAVAGQIVNDHPMVLRRYPAFTEQASCHIAYITGSPTQTIEETLLAARRSAVLTVTDAQYGDARGIIHFHIVSGRVRFQIDRGLASEARLDIGSRLLGLGLTAPQDETP